jgi:hypothetical protein
VARRSGSNLMVAGLIVSFVGLCIVVIRVMHVPAYWTPLMVGIGIFLLGLIRWLMSNDA